MRFFVIFSIFVAFCFAKEMEQSDKKVEIKGDSIVILDSSCNSNSGLLSKMKTDSKINQSTQEDCEVPSSKDKKATK